MKRVLFVCTGNICRSPTAEAVFRHKVMGRGLKDQFDIDSAGTHGYHIGEPPDHRSVETARGRGVSMEGQAARKVSVQDFHDFDLILAMDEGHLLSLQDIKPQDGSASLQLFLDYHPERAGQNVPDPYYGGQSGFDQVFELADQCANYLLKSLIDA